MNYGLDALVILVYFALILAVGLWPRRKQDNLEEFALGARQIPWWAVMASILAAEISAATFLGAPEEGFHSRNFAYAQLTIGTVLARVIVAYIFIKPYYDYNVTSIYEFLEIRFGTVTKNAASAVFLLTRVLASGTRLYVAGVVVVLAVEMVTGIKPAPMQEVAIYIGVLAAITILTALYTSAGGIKAVVWTDVIQATVMWGALGYSLYILLHRIPGGWEGAKSYLTGPKDLTIFDSGMREGLFGWTQVKFILENEYTLWSAVLGATFITMATHGTDQDMVQRMLTAKNHHKSRLALVLSGLADIPVVLAFLTVGILLYSFYQAHPDPALPKKNIFAYWIIHELPSGARGLLVAGVLATAMGSLSTALNALATSFVKDWWLPYRANNGANEAYRVRAVKWSTAAFGAALVVVGALTAYVVVTHPKARIIPVVLGVFGYTYGSLLGIFLVGLLTKTRGNDFGNALAMICGFIVVAVFSGLPNDLLLAMGASPVKMPGWMPVIEFPWRVLFGTVTTFGVAVCFKK